MIDLLESDNGSDIESDDDDVIGPMPATSTEESSFVIVQDEVRNYFSKIIVDIWLGNSASLDFSYHFWVFKHNAKPSAPFLLLIPINI